MGINVNDAFPSKWLASSDVPADRVITIRSVRMDEVGRGEHKPVIKFDEYEKEMVLNKTNASMVAKMYGDDSDGWTGRQMLLTTAWVDFQGESKLALRLRPPTRSTRPQPHQEPTQQGGDPRGDVPPPQSPADYDDDIPF